MCFTAKLRKETDVNKGHLSKFEKKKSNYIKTFNNSLVHFKFSLVPDSVSHCLCLLYISHWPEGH